MPTRPAIALLALVAAQAATAQPAPGPGMERPAQMPGGGTSPMRRVPGVSDQGNAILNEAMNTPDPQITGLIRQQRQVHDQLVQAALAATIDVDRVAALFKQREDLQAQYRQLLDARLVTALRQLPVADRAPFLRALASPAGPGGGAPR